MPFHATVAMPSVAIAEASNHPLFSHQSEGQSSHFSAPSLLGMRMRMPLSCDNNPTYSTLPYRAHNLFNRHVHQAWE
jgi:hypothetical protein